MCLELHTPETPMSPHITGSSKTTDRIEPTFRQRWRGIENVGQPFKKHCSASKTLFFKCQPSVMNISKRNTPPALAQHWANVASQSTAVDSAKQGLGFEPL